MIGAWKVNPFQAKIFYIQIPYKFYGIAFHFISPNFCKFLQFVRLCPFFANDSLDLFGYTVNRLLVKLICKIVHAFYEFRLIKLLSLSFSFFRIKTKLKKKLCGTRQNAVGHHWLVSSIRLRANQRRKHLSFLKV